MRWTDVLDIAIALDEEYPDFDVMKISFTDLRSKIVELEGFEDDPNACNEKILEAIQAAWMDERD